MLGGIVFDLASPRDNISQLSPLDFFQLAGCARPDFATVPLNYPLIASGDSHAEAIQLTQSRMLARRGIEALLRVRVTPENFVVCTRTTVSSQREAAKTCG